MPSMTQFSKTPPVSLKKVNKKYLKNMLAPQPRVVLAFALLKIPNV